MSSKAQGLSLNTIVIAAIVLVVLFILIGMTTGYFGKWGPKFNTASDISCSGQGGNEKFRCESYEKELYGAQTEGGKVCCAMKTCGDYGGNCANCPTSPKHKTEGDSSCGGGNPHCCLP